MWKIYKKWREINDVFKNSNVNASTVWENNNFNAIWKIIRENNSNWDLVIKYVDFTEFFVTHFGNKLLLHTLL